MIRTRSRRPLALAAGLAALACVAVLAVAANALGSGSARPAPRLANPTTAALPLVTHFFALLQHKDQAGLKALLAPGFQVQRADGSGAGKTEYLANLATIDTFELTKLTATESNGTLVVRYLATVTGITNGKTYAPGPAPRLSVFSWNGSRWQLAAHANFNPLTG